MSRSSPRLLVVLAAAASLLVVVLALLGASRVLGNTDDGRKGKVGTQLNRVRPVVPAAAEAERTPTGAPNAAFMTQVIEQVAGYWNDTLGSHLPGGSTVNYHWVGYGERVSTGCPDERGDTTADETAGFYCPGDDTIYVGAMFADEAPHGDFGLATILAHEYGHNLQHELAITAERYPQVSAEQFELQADCLSGVWANSAYYQGQLQAGDVEEALSTSRAAGTNGPSDDPHGSSEERAAAWQTGYDSGDPSQCTLALGDGV